MMIILVGQFNTNETLAKILDNAVIVVVNYVASKWLVFKKQKKKGYERTAAYDLPFSMKK